MKIVLILILSLSTVACRVESADINKKSLEVVNIPSLHENMVIGKTWREIITHENGYPAENCNSSTAQKSQCYFALSEGKAFPVGTTNISVSVKAKAWYKGSPNESQCLIYAYMLKNSTDIGNHFIHTEVFNHYDTYKQNRRISYVNLKIPVINGAVKIGVGKKLDDGCSMDFAIYLDGYTINNHL